LEGHEETVARNVSHQNLRRKAQTRAAADLFMAF
jgi:hypothetical protein